MKVLISKKYLNRIKVRNIYKKKVYYVFLLELLNIRSQVITFRDFQMKMITLAR